MDAITDQGMKVKVIARTFGIPTFSLKDHLYSRVMRRKKGAKTMFSQEEEGKLLDYCFQIHDLGHPLTSW